MLKVETSDLQFGPQFVYDRFLKNPRCPVNVWVDEAQITRLYQSSALTGDQISRERVDLVWKPGKTDQGLFGSYLPGDKLAIIYLKTHFEFYRSCLGYCDWYTRGKVGTGWDFLGVFEDFFAGDMDRLFRYLDCAQPERSSGFIEKLFRQGFQRQVNATLVHEVQHATAKFSQPSSDALDEFFAGYTGIKFMQEEKWRQMVKVEPKI